MSCIIWMMLICKKQPFYLILILQISQFIKVRCSIDMTNHKIKLFCELRMRFVGSILSLAQFLVIMTPLIQDPWIQLCKIIKELDGTEGCYLLWKSTDFHTIILWCLRALTPIFNRAIS